MTKVSLLRVHQANVFKPCQSFDDFLKVLGKSKPDETMLGIWDYAEHVHPVELVQCFVYLPELAHQKNRFQSWCAQTLLKYVERDQPNPEAIRRQISALEDTELSDEEREAIAGAAKAEVLSMKTVLARAAGRLCYLDDPKKVSQTAAWVSAKGGCQSASFEAQKNFLISGLKPPE